jgi:hypothetical protein
MEFLYRNATPAYKGIHPQQVSPSIPAGIVSSLFGGGTPCYKIANGNGASAPTSARSWWQALIPAPVYKTASVAACVLEPEVPPDDGGATGNGDGCVAASDQAPQVVIL